MRHRVLSTIAVLAVITVGLAAFYRSRSSSAEPQLSTAVVTRGDVVETVTATGTLEAVETVEVGTQVSGTIKSLKADFNSQVRRGQVIAELEPSLFATQVEQARATVLRLQAEVEAARVQVEDTAQKRRRARQLSEQGLLPATELETAEANARQAEASLQASEAQLVQGRASLNQSLVNLGHTTITAPIDGVVISRNVEVGQTVAASMQAPTLFVLARDLRHMQVNARIDEADIGRITQGQRVEFSVDAYPDRTFSGTVKQVRLAPVVEQNVVSYVTVIDVPNPELQLKPGMTANVSLEIARADAVLRVPNAALRFRPTAELFAALGTPAPATRAAQTAAPRSVSGTSDSMRAAVWVLAGGELRRVPVQPLVSDGVVTGVADDPLQEGANVVTGVPVHITTGSSPAGSPLLPRRPGQNRSGTRGTAAQGGSR
jgi:HlyD family secretion protein